MTAKRADTAPADTDGTSADGDDASPDQDGASAGSGRPRGRHAGLSAESVVRVAIAIADEDGLSALSMRRLAARLGVEAMALYHYFPSKAALLDAVVEEIVTTAPIEDLVGSGWEDGLRRYAHAQLAALARHPHLVELVMSRPAVTTGNLVMLEELVAFLCREGFSARRALDMVYTVHEVVLVHGSLDDGVGGARPPHGEHGQETRLSELPVDAYPHLAEAARSGRAGGSTSRFDFALDVLMAGFAEVR